MYSAANIGNGFVTGYNGYAFFRLLAGIGLAGELGAGITLVSESLDAKSRGIGTTIVAAVGICGGVAAGLVGDFLPWRYAYFLGGGLGLLLLLLRASALESKMFEHAKVQSSFRGSFLKLFAQPKRAFRYVSLVLVAVPVWYVVGILVTLAPEMGRAFGMQSLPDGGRAITVCYAGVAIGDVVTGGLSQAIRSRKRVLLGFLGLLVFALVGYFTLAKNGLIAFYVCVSLLGFATGYWAVFVTSVAEQFGTNLRATATTTAPNFVRAALVPISLSFRALQPSLGTIGSAILVGFVVLSLALMAAASISETYGKSMDFQEE
jgi:MFS transporter, putative metabolite:H+ symporter